MIAEPNEAKVASGRPESRIPIIAQVDHPQSVVSLHVMHGARIAAVHLRDALRWVCHGGTLQDCVRIVFDHKAVGVVLVLVVDL